VLALCLEDSKNLGEKGRYSLMWQKYTFNTELVYLHIGIGFDLIAAKL
jgi:hypothetical protein